MTAMEYQSVLQIRFFICYNFPGSKKPPPDCSGSGSPDRLLPDPDIHINSYDVFVSLFLANFLKKKRQEDFNEPHLLNSLRFVEKAHPGLDEHLTGTRLAIGAGGFSFLSRLNKFYGIFQLPSKQPNDQSRSFVFYCGILCVV